MKNIMVTSIFALLFLVIGLFIGKSGKPIVFPAVVKTNIVEKTVEDTIPNSNDNKIYFVLQHNEIANGFSSSKISFYIDNDLNGLIHESILRNKIELELRRIGLKISGDTNDSDGELRFIINAIPLKEIDAFVYTVELCLYQTVFIEKNGRDYVKTAPVWEQRRLGFGYRKTIQDTSYKSASEIIDAFANSVFKSREE